jgi:hypothetical protein
MVRVFDKSPAYLNDIKKRLAREYYSLSLISKTEFDEIEQKIEELEASITKLKGVTKDVTIESSENSNNSNGKNKRRQKSS